MKLLAIFLCAFSFLVSGQAAAAPQDVKGWQGYSWGMTGEQIARIGGSEITRGERWWPPKREFYVEYAGPTMRLQDMTFSVRMHMDPKTETLSEIRIVDSAPALGQVAPQRAKFDQLEALLTQKYGPAQLRTDLDESRDRVMPSVAFARTWAFPTTTIELRHDWFRSPAGDSAGSITIRYFPTKNSDSGKL